MTVGKLILASSSPRRAQLLREYGYEFEVVAPDPAAECGVCTRETPPETVCRLALQKAEDVARRLTQGLILAADTLAECQGTLLGKPQDRDHAEQMLRLMSGRRHRVYSGFVLWDVGSGRRTLGVEKSVLVMDRLEDAQLQAYLDSEQWIGKAGAFGYQDGLDWVHLVEGSESNVVGLPMERLATELSKFND